MTPKIGYVLLESPRYSETFILNEIETLLRSDIPERIFCLRNSGDGEPAPRFDGRLKIVSDKEGDVPLSSKDLADLFEANPARFTSMLSKDRDKYERRADETGMADRRDPLWKFACAVHIATECRRRGLTHLHAHYAHTPAEVAILAGKLSGVSVSFTGHAKDIFTMRPDKLKRTIEQASFVLGCSRTGVEHMRDAAPSCAERIHLVYHGIRIEDWPQINLRERAESVPRILSVGRLTPKKGFSTLIEAVGAIGKRGREVQLEIIGEGRERAELEGLARTMGIADRVRLPGRLDQSEIRERFARAPIFVLPSIRLASNNQDGVANALLEAMASGLPIVASDIPAFKEIIDDGANGLLFESGNSSELTSRLELLLQRNDMRVSLGRAARTRVESLTCCAAAERLSELFIRYAD